MVRDQQVAVKGIWSGILGGMVLMVLVVLGAVFVGMAAAVVTEMFWLGWDIFR